MVRYIPVDSRQRLTCSICWYGSVPRNLAYVACELPNNPFSPEQLVQFDARLNAVVPDVDRRMEYRHLHWIHGLTIMTLILSPSGQALPPDL